MSSTPPWGTEFGSDFRARYLVIQSPGAVSAARAFWLDFEQYAGVEYTCTSAASLLAVLSTCFPLFARMKLHLPVRLFRAVVALMTAGSCSAFAATATAIPSGYSKVIEVNTSSDFSVPSSTLSTAYVLNRSISITINAANKNLFFTSADENALKSITLQCASYTRALTGGQIEFNGLADLSLQNQSSLKNFSYSPIYTSGSGTRVAMKNIEKLSLIGNSCGDSDDSSYTDMHNNQWSRCG